MIRSQEQPSTPTLDDYLQLFAPYSGQLRDFQRHETIGGSRFALLFRQVLRLLAQDSPFNDRLPRLFTKVATEFLGRDHATVRHFSHEENRYIFLSDLLEWIQVHERGRRIHGMREGPHA